MSYQYRRKWIAILIALYIGIVHYQWPTLSGAGLELTSNMIVWLVVSFLVMGLASGLYRRRWQWGPAPKLALLGGGLLSLPVLWNGAVAGHILGLQRLAGLWSAICIFLLLVQWPACRVAKSVIAAIIALSATIESGLAAVQVMFPNWAATWLNYPFIAAEGRPLGALLQANLLGSFLCTGLACALWLYSMIGSQKRWLSLVILLAGGVTVTQSRTALAGMAFSVTIIMLCTAKHRDWRVTCVGILSVAVGIVLGGCVLAARPDCLNVVPASIVLSPPQQVQGRLNYNRQKSNEERQTVIAGTLAMIAQHPLKGWGAGHFEKVFPEVLSQYEWDNPFTRTVIYPHNELLYVWAEGGVIAAAGLVTLGILWSAPVLWRPRRKSVAFWAISLPLVLHMMTEYPFYQSALHLLTLVLLMASSIPRSWFTGRTVTPGYRLISILGCYSAACIGGVFMVTGLMTAMQLRGIESLGFRDSLEATSFINPWAQSDRLLFDRAVSRLINFNKTHDPQQLNAFQKEAGIYLQYHNDANLIDTLLRIARAKHNLEDVQMWNKRGCLSFPQDNRFKCL